MGYTESSPQTAELSLADLHPGECNLHPVFLSRTNTRHAGRWLVYSHYDKDGRIHDYSLSLLREVSRHGFRVLIISTSDFLIDSSIHDSSGVAHAIFTRENIGYDFYSYKLGIDYIHQQQHDAFQILLANDSMFGPVCSLDYFINESTTHHIYGVTDSFECSYHCQSYFLSIRGDAFGAHGFRRFWEEIQPRPISCAEDKLRLIEETEIKLSQIALREGLSIGSQFSFISLLSDGFRYHLESLKVASSIPESKVKPFASPTNPSHIYWDDLIERGCPFIKRELLLKNPFGVDILNWPGRVSRRSTEVLRDIALYFLHKLESISFLYNTSREYVRQFIFEDLGIVRAKRNSGFDSIIDAAGLAWAPLFYPFIFDVDYYIDTHSDIKEGLVNGKIKSAYNHFRHTGIQENRDFRLIFLSQSMIQDDGRILIPYFLDSATYSVAASSQCVYQQSGYWFNTELYLEMNPDIIKSLPEISVRTIVNHFRRVGLLSNRPFGIQQKSIT